jgi:N-acetylglutamate synthase-like GNAT family acetyltransferase
MISVALLATLPTMQQTTRVLPHNEWSRLAGTELETLAPILNPETTRIVVVERDGVIVACWAVTIMVHLEGIWIAPSHRKSASVGRALLQSAREQVRALGGRWAITGATTDDVRGLISKLGGERLPGESYIVPIPQKERA